VAEANAEEEEGDVFTLNQVNVSMLEQDWLQAG
jgi:hypothetical protein